MNRAQLTPEGELLLLCALDRTDDTDAAIRRRLGRVSLARLLALAEIERAMPVAARRIREAGGDALDAEAAATLWRHAQVAEFRMRHLQARLGETLDRLAAESIPVVLLKGAAVAATAFGSFVERPMGDIDLLVERRDARRAIDAALMAGWERAPALEDEGLYAGHHHLPPLIDGSGAGFALEVHTELLLPGHPFGLDADHVRSRAVEQVLDGRAVFVPHPADQVIHACVHFAWGHMLGGGAWRTFRDAGTLLRSGDVAWDELSDLAREMRAGSCVYWTLRLGRTAAGLTVPDAVLGTLAPGLPEVVLAFIERHALAQLLPSEQGCPSVRVRKGMWSLAIRPRRSGHGSARPWARADEWEAFAERHGSQPTPRAGVAEWIRYARALVGVTASRP